MPEPSDKPRKHRLALRRSSKKSSKVSLRKGLLGLGPNLAVSLLNVFERGACLLEKAALEPTQEVEVSLLALGGAREIVRTEQVAWAVLTTGSQFGICIQFDKILEYSAWQDRTHFAGP